jgi:hypothetical protein
LKFGEKVVVEGFQKLRDGTTVQAEPYEQMAAGGGR